MRYASSLRAETLARTEGFTPAGYHGSLLRGLMLEFADRRASLRLGIPVGSEAGSLPGTHVYREVIVDIDGLELAAIEPQRWAEGFVPRAALRVLRVEDLQHDHPADTFLTRIEVENSNSSICIAGRAAVFRWSEQPPGRELSRVGARRPSTGSG